MTSLAAQRLGLLKAAGHTPTTPTPPQRPNRPANPTTTSSGPKRITKAILTSPGPHVNLTPFKTTQKAINAKSKAAPKG